MGGASGGQNTKHHQNIKQNIFQPMTAKKPATPKPKTKPPTGPARIRYHVKKTFVNPIKSQPIPLNPIPSIPSNQIHPSSNPIKCTTPTPPGSVQRGRSSPTSDGFASGGGFSKHRWNSALCVSESSHGRPSWRGTRQLCVHHAPAQPCQCRLQLNDSS